MYKEISWHDEAVAYAEMYGMTKEDCEAIMLSKSNPTLDPRSGDVGHLIVRYRAGDVTVVVGHRDKEYPVIMAVMVRRPDDNRGSRGSGGTTGSDMPKSMRDLVKRIHATGYKTEMGGAHYRVVSREGDYISTFASTPSDKYSIPNAWRQFTKRRIEFENRKKNERDESSEH